MKTLNLAVIGKDVSKSLSPEMHAFIAEKTGNNVNYRKISIPEEEFEGSIESLISELDGFNVTIPYKLSIIKHLEKTVGDATSFGAVNTVTARTGYNTDGEGFSLMLKNNGVDVKGKNVLLIGAGGAGRSVAKKLIEGGAAVDLYDLHYENALSVGGVRALKEIEVKPYFLIVNASGVGMHKTEGISPVGEEVLRGCDVALDLIYTPEKSKFLQIAESLGKKIINGAAMLFYQAYYAECVYFDRTANEAEAKRLFEEFKENIK